MAQTIKPLGSALQDSPASSAATATSPLTLYASISRGATRNSTSTQPSVQAVAAGLRAMPAPPATDKTQGVCGLGLAILVHMPVYLAENLAP
jgi:hypothetical protein